MKFPVGLKKGLGYIEPAGLSPWAAAARNRGKYPISFFKNKRGVRVCVRQVKHDETPFYFIIIR